MKHVLLFAALCASIFSFSQQAGKLDSIFGINGRAYTTNVEGVARKIHAYADGRVLVAGHTPLAADSTCNIQLTQFKDDGTLDSTFGINGVALGARLKDSTYFNMRMLSDGKIMVMTNIYSLPNSIWQLQKFNSNGSPDSTFSINSLAQLHVDSTDRAIDFLVQPDNSILIIGPTLVGITNVRLFSLMRVTASGFIDSTYGLNGRTVTNIAIASHIYFPTYFKAIAQQPDGKILIGVSVYRQETDFDFLIVRINNDGSTDSTFGVNGKAYFDESNSSDYITCINVLANGKILAGGHTDYYGGFQYLAGQTVRFNGNGSIDSTFGYNGSVGRSDYYVTDIVVQPDNRILCMMSDGDDDVSISRYNQNGSVDNTFGYTGAAYPDYQNMFSKLKNGAIAYVSNNKIFLASTMGYAHDPSQYVLVAKFNTDLYYPVCSTTYRSFNMTRCANQPVDFYGGNYNETGVYTDTIENVAGCDSVVTLNLLVKDLTPLSIDLPDSLCVLRPITLNALPVGGMLSGLGVSNGELDPNVHNGNPYGYRKITYTYIDNNSCTNTLTDSTNVVYCNDEATTCSAHFTLYRDTVTENHWYLLNESTTSSSIEYTWSWGDNTYSYTDTPSHVYLYSGVYNICLYIYDAVNFCQNEYCELSVNIYKNFDSIRVDVVNELPVVEEPVSVADLDALQLSAVPNPTNSFVNITATLTGIAQVTITDNIGRIVYAKQVEGTLNAQIDMSAYSNGMYLLRVTDGKGRYSTKRIMKQ